MQSEFLTVQVPNFTARPGGGAGVKRAPVEEIVGFLSFSSDHSDPLHRIDKFTQRQWKHVLQWLDDSGLAFYFLQKLNDSKANDVVPPVVLSRLARNFAANHLRVDDMSHRFAAINGRFTDAGVRFAVLKGFSLVPEFCPFAPLRHQADLDYLVDEPSLAAACRVLIDAGYKQQDSRSINESIFVSVNHRDSVGTGGESSRSDWQYSPQAPHAVELHTDIWDSAMHSLPPIPNVFSAAQARIHHWDGLIFPAPTDEDAFLLQVFHACRHLFTQWIRLSCLYEIGYFLHRRASDTELWSRIEQRAGDSAVLREFVVIVTEMAAQLFAAPVPELVQSWGARVRPGARIWMEHYARNWALGGLPVYEFTLFPRAKLALFLHQQYKSASWAQELPHQNKLSASRLSRIASSIKKDPALALNLGWWKRQQLFRRTIFHGLAELRYACEIPRWKWRNRASPQATPTPWPPDSLPMKKAS